MKFSTAVGCCPCSWPYLFTLSYISAKKKSKMEEREKPVSLLVNQSEQALLSSQAESTANNEVAENAETLKSPNMSTDSGFEGENNRPLLLQTNLPSPAEDAIISSWRNDVFHAGELEFDVAELGSPKSPKKSTEDSDFNESPFDKKSVPSVGDIQSESDNDDSDNHCTFHNATPIWCNGEISGWKENYIDSCQGTTINGIQLIEELPDDEASGYSGKNCFVPATHCTCNGCGAKCKVSLLVSSESEGWNGVLTSELKDCVVYADINNSTHIGNSDNDEQGEKLDTETDDGSDERNFDGTYSDDTLSAYYVPSAISTTTEDYQLHPPVPPPRGIRPFRLKREGTQSEADADISPASTAYYKSLRSQSEPSQYTTVLKPKAVRPPPPANVDRVEYHSSLESLHSGHIADVLGQRQDRLSAFRERPRSSLSQSENVHVFFSRSLDTPPLIPPSRNPSDRSIAMITSIVVSPSRGGSRSSSSPHPVLSWNDVNNIVHSDDSSKRLEDVDQSSDTNIASVSKEKVPDSMSQVVEDSNAITATSPSQTKRHSMPWDLFWNSEATRRPISDYDPNREPIHMTLEEVRSSLQTLTRNDQELNNESSKSVAQDNKPSNKRLLGSYLWQKKNKKIDKSIDHAKRLENQCQRKSFPFSIKTAFTNLFGLKRACSADSRFSPSHSKSHDELSSQSSKSKSSPNTSPFTHRALPPLPSDNSAWQTNLTVEEESWSDECGMSQTYDENRTDICEKRKLDYAASIEKVKDCGWYWGPISGEMAEKLLANEPDGSFVVRDSSDEHYIFSLTFKLNGLVRHVRIEHDHGNFSFGCQQKFRSNTIVDFIENAVAHSRSGRYLFFLHRRPILGPMQVQLLHPVSRFKQVQSLQHLCRFVILKTVRRDLIGTLPLPRRMKDYLNTPHYYSEELAYLSQQGKKCETVADNSSHSIGMSDNTYSQHIVQEASSLSNQAASEV